MSFFKKQLTAASSFKLQASRKSFKQEQERQAITPPLFLAA
nr:hypothetical protein [uncultured Pseudomonas sp.]